MFRSHFDDFEVFVLIFVELLICIIRRGVQSTVETAPNEAIHLCWKQSLINSVYLQNPVWTVEQAVLFNFAISAREWQGAKPSTPSTTIFQLHCCRNLTSIPINYQGLSCIRTFCCLEQGRWKNTFFKVSHSNSSKICLLGLLDCFCTWDAFHISNSIRCFWASVCVWNMCVCVCVESLVQLCP